MVYRRGKVWWYEFGFQSQRIRESAHTNSKTIAREAERKRRQRLEEAVNGIKKRERPPLFSIGARQWLDSKTALTPLGRAYYEQYVRKLSRHFGDRLVSDIDADDIARLQRKRQGQGLSGRQVNCEVATLRAILKYHGLWALIAHRVKMLPERSDAGRALSVGDESKLLDAVSHSISPALYPFFLLSLDAGLRPSETRALRRCDLSLRWSNGVIEEGEIVVPRSKTDAGVGRVVPLSRRLCAALSIWLARFPDAGPNTYIFPAHRIGFAGDRRKPHLWDVDLNRPLGRHSHKSAFRTACRRAGVDCRLYDARHSFVTRLAETPSISTETIRQLAGHVSERMLSRYAHIRAQARREAIAAIEAPRADFEGESPQKSPQFTDSATSLLN